LNKRCSMCAGARQASYEADFGQATHAPKFSTFLGLYKSAWDQLQELYACEIGDLCFTTFSQLWVILALQGGGNEEKIGCWLRPLKSRSLRLVMSFWDTPWTLITHCVNHFSSEPKQQFSPEARKLDYLKSITLDSSDSPDVRTILSISKPITRWCEYAPERK